MRKSLFTSAVMLICSLVATASSLPAQKEKAMSGFKLHAEQPQTVSQRSNLTFFKDLTPDEEKERLANKGIFVTHSFDTPATEDGRILPAKAPMREDEPTYTLTVNLNYGNEEVERVENGTAYPDFTQDYWFFNEWTPERTPDQIEFIVPQGMYDIEVTLRTSSYDFILLTAHDIEVAGDMEMDLNADDATVEITWNAVLPDGATPNTDVAVYDPETFELIDIITGNSLSVYNQVQIYDKKHNLGSVISFNPLEMIVGDSKMIIGQGNIKTMPDDNYAFYLIKKVITVDGGYVIPLIADGKQSTEVSNNINDYVTFEPEFADTPYKPEARVFGEGDEQIIWEFDKNKAFCLNFNTIQNNILEGSSRSSFINADNEIKQLIYVCQNPEFADILKVMPVPSKLEDWDFDYNMKALPIDAHLEIPTVLCLNNTSDFNSYINLPNERGAEFAKITNPWFSFDVTKPHVWNYGCPALVFSTTGSEWGSNFNYAYIGRLGENRSIDLLSTKAKVSVDDAAPSDEVLENLQWGRLPEEGKIDFEFTDTNVAIDGIEGKNVARVGFDMSRSDWQPPTLQIVRFVDKDGNFTDRYATGEDGVIEFYGGDFEYVYNPDTYVRWYTETPASEVKVEYAPYGTDSFLPLEVENVAEKDFMPGFGTYYRGSLAGVDRKSGNGWFDVRITLTDASGNFQEQTLSPAFKIDESVGVETMAMPGMAVTVAGGMITVCGCENPVIEIYSTDGTLLRRVNATSVDASGFSRGIYLVNVTDGSKKALRKVRI